MKLLNHRERRGHGGKKVYLRVCYDQVAKRQQLRNSWQIALRGPHEAVKPTARIKIESDYGPRRIDGESFGALARICCQCKTVVPQMSRLVGKDLQPERFEQSHAQNVLLFVADGDVVEENPFKFETEAAVEIDVAYVDVGRVDVNLV